MKKIKKFLTSIGIFVTGVFLRVLPVLSMSFYGGDIDYDSIVAPTNEKKVGLWEKISEILQPILTILLPIILLIIGLVVLLNKKISKKMKIVLLTIAILLVVLSLIIL